MTVDSRRKAPFWILPLAIGAAFLAGFAAFIWLAIAITGGPGWQVSATNQPDGVLVAAFIGDAPEPHYSVVLEGRSIPRDALRATPENFDPEIFESSYDDSGMAPGYWRFKIDDVPVSVVRPWMRVGDWQGSDLEVKPGESARYPMKEDPPAESPASEAP